MSLLELRNVNVDIYDDAVLRDIHLALEPGRVCGIIGESGSGKSITALSIMGLLPDDAVRSGQIIFNQQDISQYSDDALCLIRGREIAMVFQEPMTALNPLHTIGQQVVESILLHTQLNTTEANRLAGDTLERCGLPSSEFPLHRYPHELSGGQRQRVVIAIAVALKPKLLIADEPTTALDVTTQAEILTLLKSLQQSENMAMMLISHDLAVVANVADDVVIMRGGEIVERNTAKSLFSAPKHDYTRAHIAASAHVPERFDQLRDAHLSEQVDSLLNVDNLVCDYPMPGQHLFQKKQFFRAVDDVSFTIAPGESVGLVGESGCGKSTLTRALLGLIRTTSGSARLEGQSLSGGESLSRELRSRIQVVFQDPYSSFNPRHRVHRLIAEPLHVLAEKTPAKQKRALVEAMLISVGLQASDADKYIHEFSGGQRQRIAIARALIIRPKLIILDEAVSALDVSVRAQILDLLAELGNTLKLAYLFISHDLSVVKNITDRVLVMHQGKIVERGSTDAVFNNPVQDYTRQLLAATPRLDAF